MTQSQEIPGRIILVSPAPCASDIDLLLTAPSPEPAGLLASRLALAGESGELLLLFGVAGGDVTLGVAGATYAIMASLSKHFTSSACQSNHMYMFTQQYTCCQCWNLRCLILSFFRVLSKNRYPGIECFIVLSSPEILALLFLLEEVKLQPRPPPFNPIAK